MADPERTVPKRARREANRRKKPSEPLSRSEALAEAPWEAAELPAAWERAFREAYADRLEERGYSTPAARSSGKSGAGGKTALLMRPLRQTEEEFAEQDARCKAAGLSWSTWARRKLGEP